MPVSVPDTRPYTFTIRASSRSRKRNVHFLDFTNRLCLITGFRLEADYNTLFWVVTQRLVVISNRRFGKTYRFFFLGGGDSWPWKMGPDRLSWNVGNKLPLLCVITEMRAVLNKWAYLQHAVFVRYLADWLLRIVSWRLSKETFRYLLHWGWTKICWCNLRSGHGL